MAGARTVCSGCSTPVPSGWRKNFECRTAFDAETGAPLKFETAGEMEKGIKAFKLSDPITIKKHEFRAIAIGAED